MPQRCNKTVAKINLSKMRTSCQINYPESASKYHVAPTIGGPPKPAKPRTEVDHMKPVKLDQLKPGDIKKEIVESYAGNHSGAWSDWQATSPKARMKIGDLAAARRRSPQKKRRPKRRSPSPSGGRKGKPVNRHSRDAIKAEVDARRAQYKPEEKVLLLKSAAGEKGTVLRRADLAQMQNDTGFGTDELRKVMRSFKAHAGGATAVTKANFEAVMSDVFDRMTPEFCDRLFTSMDSDGSGSVDYRELISGCAKLIETESSEEKYKLIFEAYDSDSSGTISAAELMKIAHEKGREMEESLDLVKNVMGTIDSDGSGVVSYTEFLGTCQGTPLLLDAFEQLLPSPNLLKKQVKELSDACGQQFDWERLNDMSTFLKHQGVHSKGDSDAITRSAFRSLMNDFFGFHDSVLTGNMFDTMDQDGSGLIDFKELMTGLSMALRGSPEQRLEFYFQLYDMDGSGTIDEAEIYRLLERGHSTANMHASGAAVQACLDQHGLTNLDANGDGHISHAEFIEAVKEQPEIMRVFGSVVH